MHHSKTNGTESKSQVKDNTPARLVALCGEQIEAAIQEALTEIEAISHAVLDASDHALELQCQNNAPYDMPKPPAVVAESEALREALSDACMKLQFADRLTQRLMNVSKNLSGLSELMHTIEVPITNTLWSSYLETSRESFTMENEREMFDAIFDTSTGDCAPNNDSGSESLISQGPVLFDIEVSSNEVK